MSEWISLKEKLPPMSDFFPGDEPCNYPYIFAYHSIYGVGVAWFNQLDDGLKETLEEEYGDKYICSCHFIKSTLDGNYCVSEDDEIDIFEHSPRFHNLGTVTHWMPLPKPPKDKDEK